MALPRATDIEVYGSNAGSGQTFGENTSALVSFYGVTAVVQHHIFIRKRQRRPGPGDHGKEFDRSVHAPIVPRRAPFGYILGTAWRTGILMGWVPNTHRER